MGFLAQIIMTRQNDRELQKMRETIDKIDEKIVSLLEERLKIAHEVGKYKRKRSINIEDSSREKEVLSRVEKLARDLNKDFLTDIYRRIILESKRAQRQGKISILGPRGTFSEEAAYRFMTSPALVLARDLEEIFNFVINGEVEFGIIPIENSIEGSVHIAQELLIKREVKVYSEIILEINHCLLTLEGVSLKDIKEVISHPQALAQCKQLIRDLGTKTRNAPSTADAAREIRTKKLGNLAAIAPLASARLYNLKILKENVQDVKENKTRFLVISQTDHKPTGKDKTSIILSLRNKSGALYETLKIFAENGINLTKIESRPSRRALGDYVFFIDLDGHRKEKNIKEVLENLRLTTSFLKVLGSYPRIE